MTTVWSWLMLARVSRLVRDLRTGVGTDEAYTAAEGMPLQVAEAISHACAPDGLNWPRDDAKLLAVLVRDGYSVPVDSAPYGSVVETTSGRLGLVTNGGAIESHGAALSVVPHESGRWVRAWLIPGVSYFERVTT
ncbi:putative structural protein [Arthrobacter phage vB_ArtM-ArV1]|uniref:Putative structural protein n=1 Tax=Arthrobacter phage vB_ArtM-ArV1 TaxID=1566993 RepID=A0A0A7HEQ6_9CAUD|nr:putative structural protein [Arthrobacter phage vB_ArtM-ArV1]AIZ01709.1 putative structural protein [Arthrobacter phage vB_ArtM-ArV1]